MAHFYAGIHGSRGEITRLGTKKSGMSAFVNGWNIGVEIWARYDEANDCDIITITPTGGSNHGNVDAKPIIIQNPVQKKLTGGESNVQTKT